MDTNERMSLLLSLLLVIFTTMASDVKSQNTTLGEQMIHSTSKISCVYESTLGDGNKGYARGSGTGFFYTFEIDSIKVPVIATNKHVVEDAISGSIQFTMRNATGDGPDYGNYEVLALDSFEYRWIPHPDEDVDLCIMPIYPIEAHFERIGKIPFYVSIDKSIIPHDSIWQQLEVIEEVTMIGYPNGVYDDVNNVPIVRKGQTASPLKVPFKGEEEFMINITSIPGSSGSPVYLYNEGSYLSGSSIVFGSRIYFLGILYAGPVQATKGVGEIIIDKIPVNFNTYTNLTIGLGTCIRSTRMDDFIPVLERMIK